MAAPAAQQVRIETQKGVAFGQTIKAVGSAEALGNWDTAAAPGVRNIAAALKSALWHTADCQPISVLHVVAYLCYSIVLPFEVGGL